MNPHDPAVHPGAHLVAEELGTEDPWTLAFNFPIGDPRCLVARMVAFAAEDVDALHAELTRAAQSAIELLEPVSRGEHADLRGVSGLLPVTGPQIELLIAHRGAAYKELTRAVSAYRVLLREPAPPAASAGLDRQQEDVAGQAPGRDDDWALAGDRQAQALRAVERGGLRLKQSALSDHDRYLSDGSGVMVPVWTQTVERLLADGLLDIDTASMPAQGQLLSLTPLGQEALRATDDVTAATVTGPDPAPRDASNPPRKAGSPVPTPDPLPTHEELLALEEIGHGGVLLKERSFRPGLHVYTGSGARISTATVEAMRERGWIEQDTGTSLTSGQQLSLTDSGETAFRAGRAQDSRTTAALSRSRSTRDTGPSPPAEAPAAGATGQAKPTRTR